MNDDDINKKKETKNPAYSRSRRMIQCRVNGCLLTSCVEKHHIHTNISQG